jgi:hypothetical protein
MSRSTTATMTMVVEEELLEEEESLAAVVVSMAGVLDGLTAGAGAVAVAFTAIVGLMVVADCKVVFLQLTHRTGQPSRISSPFNGSWQSTVVHRLHAGGSTCPLQVKVVVVVAVAVVVVVVVAVVVAVIVVVVVVAVAVVVVVVVAVVVAVIVVVEVFWQTSICGLDSLWHDSRTG